MNCKNAFVSPHAPLMEAVHIINSCGGQIALVVDEHKRLLGTITDADVRSVLLTGHSCNAVSCAQAMQHTPLTLPAGASAADCLALMKAKHIRQLPLLDVHGKVIKLVLLEELIEAKRLPNAVVIMAGGLGTRLGKLTRDCPKPLLPVGGKPLLESIIERLSAQGFYRFFLSVNYFAEKIVAHFGDGERWNADIRYIREDTRMGTAGALSLLPESEQGNVVVTNGDILTLLNFASMLEYHVAHHAVATMAVTEY